MTSPERHIPHPAVSPCILGCEARARRTLPDRVTEEFEDDEPGAPYPTSQDA